MEHTQRYKKDDNQRTPKLYFNHYYRRIGFSEENSYYSMKYHKKRFSFA